MIKRVVFFLSAVVVALGIISAGQHPKGYALGSSDWQAGNVMDDSAFTNAGSMTVQQIQDFINGQLDAKGGCDTWGTKPATEWGRSDLTHAQYAATRGWAAPPYVCLNQYYEVPKTQAAAGTPDNSYNHYDANAKTLLTVPSGISAAQIIYNAAQQYQISPKVLLVKIQTESAGPLTQDTWPLQQQYTYALGSHCPDSGPGGSAQCDTTYAGFSIQVSSAASLLRYYLDNMQQPWWTYRVPYATNSILWNVTSRGCGASDVYINTKATAALYTYTPYQPNAAALAHVSDTSSGGTGDTCSAYGNRNFWWWFSHWFGNPSYPPSPVYIPDGTYSLVNTGSGRSADVAGGSTANGAAVQIYDGNGTPAQRWQFTRNAEGYYSIQNVASGKYLDAPGASGTPGTEMQIYDGNGSCAQTWAVQLMGSSYKLLNACSGLALDTAGSGSANSTRLQLNIRSSAATQSWYLVAQDAAVVANGFYNLQTSAGTVLDIPGGGGASGTRLQIFSSNGSGAQAWQVIRQQNGLYEFRNPQSDKYLDAVSSNAGAGTRVQIYDSNHSCAQQWAITAASGGSYTVTSSCSGKKLDVAGGATSTNGTAVDIWDGNGTDAQSWKLTALTGIISGSPYSLQTPAGTVLDLPGGSTAAGTRLQIFSSNGSGAQVWQAIKQPNGLYEFRNPQSGKYLDVVGGSSTSGARVQIYDGNHSCAQQWTATDNGDGSYGIASSCSGKNLDVIWGAISTNGTGVDIWDGNGSGAQQWKLVAR
ncbi:MAG TPA: RICIN domain-containing protein [Candidatus Saccharimonadales bacterium]|nr:RICIN domain-containing protein [Candidatus Saccharimonadales bacterium]